jgi:thiol-disulfide isomerase/thioredoxin
MFWLFATWCPTCEAGTAAVAQHASQLEQAGVQIVQLKLYNNLGYPGPSAQEFARAFARSPRPTLWWLWGEASQEASYIYDPKGYPDLYFLIDRDGIVQAINGAPNVTMDEILSFARTGR